jgi:hypothetical protein
MASSNPGSSRGTGHSANCSRSRGAPPSSPHATGRDVAFAVGKVILDGQDARSYFMQFHIVYEWGGLVHTEEAPPIHCDHRLGLGSSRFA